MKKRIKVTIESDESLEPIVLETERMLLIPLGEDTTMYSFNLRLLDTMKAYTFLEDYIIKNVNSTDQSLSLRPRELIMNELKNIMKEALN